MWNILWFHLWYKIKHILIQTFWKVMCWYVARYLYFYLIHVDSSVACSSEEIKLDVTDTNGKTNSKLYLICLKLTYCYFYLIKYNNLEYLILMKPFFDVLMSLGISVISHLGYFENILHFICTPALLTKEFK